MCVDMHGLGTVQLAQVGWSSAWRDASVMRRRAAASQQQSTPPTQPERRCNESSAQSRATTL